MSDPRPDGVYPPSLGYEPDPTRLSPNGAKKLLEPGGPAKFDWARKHPQKTKREWDFGRVAHKIILGEGDEFLVLDPQIHGLKKDGEVAANPRATATWALAETKARAEGLTPIHADDYRKAIEMANVVHEHPLAGPLLAEGSAENWLYATEPETGQGLRMRTDWMTRRDRLYAIEYKSAADAEPKAFARKAYDFGYHVAFAFAVTMAQLLELDDAPAYLVIAQEKAPPYLVSVNEFDSDAYTLGMRQMQQAIALYRECCETGVWPGYPPEIHSLSLPAWALAQNQPTIGDLLERADP